MWYFAWMLGVGFAVLLATFERHVGRKRRGTQRLACS